MSALSAQTTPARAQARTPLAEAQRDYDRALTTALRAKGDRLSAAWAAADRAMGRLQRAARGSV